MTNMSDIINAADHAAMQSDRWLFVATLLILIVGAVFLWRWMTEDRKAVAERLTSITDRHITQSEKLAEVVTNNTAALQTNSQMMAKVADQIGRCEAVRKVQSIA